MATAIAQVAGDGTVPALVGMWSFAFSGDHRTRTRSTPGHLIHLVTAGTYRLGLLGRQHHVGPGTAIWYHDEDAVEVGATGSAVRFWSCGFHLPDLVPPEADHRVWRAEAGLVDAFRRGWKQVDGARDPRSRQLWAQAMAVSVAAQVSQRARLPASLWSRAEERAPACGYHLEVLARDLGVGVSTLQRACRDLHGQAPGRRLRALRLQRARELLQQTPLPIAEVARRCAYRCSQDLARAFRQAFGQAPGDLRR